MRITAEILPENDAMLRICRILEFSLSYPIEEHAVHAELWLAFDIPGAATYSERSQLRYKKL